MAPWRRFHRRAAPSLAWRHIVRAIGRTPLELKRVNSGQPVPPGTPTGGQVWKSTGLTDRDQALLVARKWEAEARVQRARLGRTAKKPIWRVRRPASSTGIGPLSQKEVAMLLNMSERGVREVERRAFQKLRNHPLLRRVWQQYLVGELEEHGLMLTPEEAEALFRVACTPEERGLIQRVLRLIQR
jgi:hypothetical protein